MSHLGGTWVPPTLRLLPWVGMLTPLVAATALGWGVAAATGELPELLVAATVLAAAAAVVLPLDDPAHALLAATPTDRRARALHRLALAVPVVLLGWLAATRVLAGSAAPAPADSTADLLAVLCALAATGLAVAAVVARHRPEVAGTAGLSTALGTFVARSLIGDGLGWNPFDLWADQPWLVASVGAVVAVVSLREPGRAGSGPSAAPAGARRASRSRPRAGSGR